MVYYYKYHFVDFSHRLTTKFERLNSQRFEDWLCLRHQVKDCGGGGGGRGVINLICWVLLIELVPIIGQLVQWLGLARLGLGLLPLYHNPTPYHFSPDDEDRVSLRNVVNLIF